MGKWKSVAGKVEAGWWLDEGVDVEGVRDGRGAEVELAGHVAVDDGGDERNGVTVAAVHGDTNEHMVKGVIVAVVLNANPAVREKVLGNGNSALLRREVVDVGVSRADGVHV